MLCVATQNQSQHVVRCSRCVTHGVRCTLRNALHICVRCCALQPQTKANTSCVAHVAQRAELTTLRNALHVCVHCCALQPKTKANTLCVARVAQRREFAVRCATRCMCECVVVRCNPKPKLTRCALLALRNARSSLCVVHSAACMCALCVATQKPKPVVQRATHKRPQRATGNAQRIL